MRFRAEQHLCRQGDIRDVREQGRRVDCQAFTVWWTPRRDPAAAVKKNPSRVCVIASTKAVGHAVLRNRAKRRLREVFRHQQQHLPPNCDLLLIARSAATRWPIAELEKRFAQACTQITPPRAPTESP